MMTLRLHGRLLLSPHSPPTQRFWTSREHRVDVRCDQSRATPWPIRILHLGEGFPWAQGDRAFLWYSCRTSMLGSPSVKCAILVFGGFVRQRVVEWTTRYIHKIAAISIFRNFIVPSYSTARTNRSTISRRVIQTRTINGTIQFLRAGRSSSQF